jgi:diguanylate cyclase (GGDEF)-like protein
MIAALMALLLAWSVFGMAAQEDPALEQRLDEYISQLDADLEAQYALLLEITDDVTDATPIDTRVRALGYLALAYLFRDDNEIERALTLIDELIEQAEASGSPQAQAEALAFRIEALVRDDRSTEALVLAPQLEPLLAETVSPRVRYYAHNVLARLLQSAEQHEEALEHFLAAYDAVQETDDERTALRRQFLNTSIAYLQAELRHYDSALAMTERAIRESERLEDHAGIPSLLLLQGYLESSMELHEEAIETYQRVIELGRNHDQAEIVLLGMNNIGSALIHLQRYAEAEEMLNTALGEAIEQEDEITTELLRFNLGYVAVMQGDHDDGIRQLEDAEAQLREHYSRSDMADLLKYVAEAQQAAGRHEQAIESLLEQRELNEELFQAERDRSLNELQARYEAKEQATQIQLLEQRNALQERLIENKRLQQRVAMLVALVILMGLILLWLAWRAARRANLRLKVANRQLQYQSSHDPLTGLLNRRLFQKRMGQRLGEIEDPRDQDHPDALILLDVDYFKKINDNFGHAAGDAVLVELAERLKKMSRSSDMVVRWGGEELLLFLQNMDPEALSDYTGKVLEIIGSEPVMYEGKSIRITATGGFITLPFAGLDEDIIGWEKALQIADLALYVGKTHGRNQAIGVLGLQAPLEKVGPLLQQDLAKAIEKGWVRSVTIPGPPPDPRYSA